MPAAKDAHALVSHFIKEYKQRHGVEPVVNRHQARWGFDSLLMDFNYAQGKELISFYLNTTGAHTINGFLNNYDRIAQSMADAKEDKELRARLAEESKARAEKWRQMRANQGIESNKLGS